MTKVYMAGPVSGLHLNELLTHRSKVAKLLRDVGLTGVDPLRGLTYGDIVGPIPAAGCSSSEASAKAALTSPKGILYSSFFDVQHCDAVLVDYTINPGYSLGTAMEIAWAFQGNKPIVMVADSGVKFADHAMITEACQYRVNTLEEAAALLRVILEGR